MAERAMSHVGESFKSIVGKYNRMQQVANKLKGKAEGLVSGVVREAESLATGVGLGIFDGRTGGKKLLGIPATLGVAFLGHGVGMFMDDGVAEHCHNIGTAGTTCFGYTLGDSIGVDWKEGEDEKDKKGKQKTLTDEQARAAAAKP